jgi:flagellar hook assembly protein FlgD
VNWHSASESAGWGTPGAPNSVFVELPSTSDKVVFSSSKISPDNDGYEDLLVIRFTLTGNGNIVSVTVFDETGNYVKKIVTNMLAGPEASLIWDGTADDGSPVKTGIYIVLITLYDETGKTNKWKKVCTVIR